jgi:hypothetical protein
MNTYISDIEVAAAAKLFAARSMHLLCAHFASIMRERDFFTKMFLLLLFILAMYNQNHLKPRVDKETH